MARDAAEYVRDRQSVIRKRTLFVLGAGASEPYGFPLGSGLRDAICNAQNESDAATALLASALKIHPERMQPVARAFARSSERSIDAFLSRNPQYADIGKALIAANLCVLEDPDYFYNKRIDDHWYAYLWNHLIDETREAHELSSNAVRFLTFNYDRSLEYFLHESAKHTYNVDDKQARDALKALPILHLYGTLGELSVGGDASLAAAYQNKYIGEREISIAMKSIRLIPEDREPDTTFQLARKWFDWAERVYILGFGFDRMNCTRLGFSNVAKFKKDRNQPLPQVYATTFRLNRAEVAHAVTLMFQSQMGWNPYDANSTTTLRWFGPLT